MVREMQSAERGRDGEWATTDLVDGMALRAMNAHECQAPLGCRRLGAKWTACQRKKDAQRNDEPTI